MKPEEIIKVLAIALDKVSAELDSRRDGGPELVYPPYIEGALRVIGCPNHEYWKGFLSAMVATESRRFRVPPPSIADLSGSGLSEVV